MSMRIGPFEGDARGHIGFRGWGLVFVSRVFIGDARIHGLKSCHRYFEVNLKNTIP